MMQPATQAEFTLLKNDIDFYDVEVINGFNMGLSMGPTNAQAGGSSEPYTCGVPGAKHPKTNVGGCTWDLNPPSNDYVWVTAGGNGCSSDSQCSGSQCGISFNPGHADLL